MFCLLLLMVQNTLSLKFSDLYELYYFVSTLIKVKEALKMVDCWRKMILEKYPNYDFERYRFKAGDCVKTNDNAIIIVKASALEYVTAYVIRRGFKYNKLGETDVQYSDIPYSKKGEFKSLPYKSNKSLKWRVSEIREIDGMTILLYKEVEHQGFYGFVLKSEDPYYLNTGVYVRNDYRDYIQA